MRFGQGGAGRDGRRPAIAALGVAISLGVVAGVRAALPAVSSTEAPFLAENRVAMDRMMAGMEVRPSGDVDRDFATMMIAHHQGAIDMAEAELRHGRNEQLRRIAQGIIVEQQQEITAMRLALGQPTLPPPAAGPGQPQQLPVRAAPPASVRPR